MTKGIFSTEDILKVIVKKQRIRDKEDLKNKLNPLYDIEQSVHKVTLKELLELHEAIAEVSASEMNQRLRKEVEAVIDEIFYIKGFDFPVVSVDKILELKSRLFGQEEREWDLKIILENISFQILIFGGGRNI